MTTDSTTVSLVVRRTVRATPERVFQAWTRAEQVQKWWGPGPVKCVGAEIDLRVGGAYRIGNELPDGRVLWISGEFERVTPPHELVYTWSVRPDEPASRVTVRFEERGAETEVIIVHERIVTEEMRADHEHGWQGCLEGLFQYLS